MSTRKMTKIILKVLPLCCHGDGWFSIKLLQYNNTDGRGANGNCCDDIVGKCDNSCEHYFQICLDPAGSAFSVERLEGNCRYGLQKTDRTKDENFIVFGPVIGRHTPNPLIFDVPGALPSVLDIKVKVEDQDQWSKYDDIDFLNETVSLRTLRTSSYRLLAGRTALTMEVHFGCNDTFYGLDCGSQCRVGDHVTHCNEDGTKLCKEGWTGMNCDQSDVQTTIHSPTSHAIPTVAISTTSPTSDEVTTVATTTPPPAPQATLPPPPERICSVDQFSCPKGSCISTTWLCDRELDCPNGEDEMGPQCRGRACAAGQFRCANQQCINETLRCDNVEDCSSGEDEKQCCGAGDFQCDNGLCLPNTVRCNGLAECPDKSDERNCDGRCSSKQFNCGKNEDGKYECITKEKVCDGKRDCHNGLDENNKTCVSNPCSNPDTCSQVCHQTSDGGFQCACKDGYVLDKSDKTLCLVEQTSKKNETVISDDPRLIYSTRDSIKVRNLRSGITVTLQDSIYGAVGVAADVGAFIIYFSDVHESAIKKFEAGKRDKPTALVGGLDIPGGLAFDWANRNLYWTDTGTDRIQVANVDTKLVATLVSTGLDEPRGIVVDPRNGWMFWTDWGEKPLIKAAGMDGSRVQTFIKTGLYWPNGITIDYPNDRLYWMDARLHVLSSCDLDGQHRRNMYMGADALAHPFGLAIFEDILYISDWESQQLYQVPRRNTTQARPLTEAYFQAPNDLIIYHPMAQPPAPIRCQQNGGCSDLCLAAPGTSSTTCVCKDGSTLQADGKRCS